MSQSGRATEFMRLWGEGHNRRHIAGHQRWGADECAPCVAELYSPWEALVHAARIAGFLPADGGTRPDDPTMFHVEPPA